MPSGNCFPADDEALVTAQLHIRRPLRARSSLTRHLACPKHLGRRKLVRRSALERWERLNEKGSFDGMAPRRGPRLQRTIAGGDGQYPG